MVAHTTFNRDCMGSTPIGWIIIQFFVPPFFDVDAQMSIHFLSSQLVATNPPGRLYKITKIS